MSFYSLDPERIVFVNYALMADICERSMLNINSLILYSSVSKARSFHVKAAMFSLKAMSRF